MARVQTKTNVAGSSVSSLTITPDSNVTLGNTLIVVVTDNYGVINQVSSMTDNLGNTYTRMTSNTDGSFVDGEIWYTPVVHAGACTITVNFSHSVNCGLLVAEHSGLTASPYDVSASAYQASGTSHDSGATATTAQADELVVGACVSNDTTGTLSAGSGYSDLVQAVNGTTGTLIGIQSKVVSAIGTYNSIMTTNHSDHAVSMVATFKIAPTTGKQLTIAGTNFLPQYKTNSSRIRELIQNKSGVMNMEITVKPGQSVPLQGSEIIYKDGTRFLFGGYVTRISPKEIGKGQLFVYTVEASDYSFILNNKVARRAYNDMTLGAIVVDLMNTYVDSSYGFDLSNVATGPIITSVVFDHISIRKCFEKLSKLTGYVWNVDYQKKLYFRTQTSTPAPEAITDASTNYNSVNIVYDTTQVRNKVIVIGSDTGEPANAPTTQQFTADGISRIWGLDDVPASVSYIKIDGVSKNFHEASQQIASDYFIYTNGSVYFQLTDTSTTPTVGQVIEIAYYPFIDIIAERSDVASLAFFSALDGGDGEWNYTIKDQSITTKQEAAERALKELAEFADPLVNGQFVTRTSLLSPGTVFAVGQVLTVNLPTYSINSDTTFMIQEVNIEVNEDGSNTEYIYTVRFGGRLAGVQEFLESLASAADETATAATIKNIELLTDSETIADSGLTHTIATPPFKYTSGSPVGKWNQSEWS